MLEGNNGIEKVSAFSRVNGISTMFVAAIVMFAAGITVLLMTKLRLPVSTSQAVIGAIMGHGLLMGQGALDQTKAFVGAWIFTPIGGMVFAMLLYGIVKKYFEERLTKFSFFFSHLFGLDIYLQGFLEHIVWERTM